MGSPKRKWIKSIKLHYPGADGTQAMEFDFALQFENQVNIPEQFQ
jgi:hypothetical protein